MITSRSTGSPKRRAPGDLRRYVATCNKSKTVIIWLGAILSLPVAAYAFMTMIFYVWLRTQQSRIVGRQIGLRFGCILLWR